MERNAKAYSDYFRACCPAIMANGTRPGHVCKEEKLMDKIEKYRRGWNAQEDKSSCATTYDTVDLSHRSVELYRARSDICCGLFNCFYLRDVTFSRAVSGSEHGSAGMRSRLSPRQGMSSQRAWPPNNDASEHGHRPIEVNRTQSDGSRGRSLVFRRCLSEKDLATAAGDHGLGADVDKNGGGQSYGILTRVGSDDSTISMNWHGGTRNTPEQGLRKSCSQSSVVRSITRTGSRDSLNDMPSASEAMHLTPRNPRFGTLTRVGSDEGDLESMDNPWHYTPGKISGYQPGSFNKKRSILTMASPSRDSPRHDSTHSSSGTEISQSAHAAPSTLSRQGSFERSPMLSLSRTGSDDSAISSSALLVRVNSDGSSVTNDDSPTGVSSLLHPPPMVDRLPIVAPRPRLKVRV
jgi:hypothetical protein